MAHTPLHSIELDDIGFYTLSEARARTASAFSPLTRAELILTDRCNFRCPYCDRTRQRTTRHLSRREIQAVIGLWAETGLVNARFSGGEPTAHPGLLEAVRLSRAAGARRIGVSTNGSRPFDLYARLLEAGVDDFSISLDAPEAGLGAALAGVAGAWERVVDNIRRLAERTYVTVNVVVDGQNLARALGTIRLAHDLGAADILVIPSTRFNRPIPELRSLPGEVFSAHPLLRYRAQTANRPYRTRGLQPGDSRRCALALDEVVIAGEAHYPCALYLREGGAPVGQIGPGMRADRLRWYGRHDSAADPLCRSMCMDFLRAYNNRYAAYHP